MAHSAEKRKYLYEGASVVTLDEEGVEIKKE